MNQRLLILVVALASLTACGGPTETAGKTPATASGTASGPSQSPAPSASPAEDVAGQLSAVVDTYFQENIKLNPIFASFIGDHRYDDQLPNSIGPEHRKKQLELEKKYLAAIREVDKASLAGQDLLTHEMFEQERIDTIKGMKYPDHLMPITQFFSVPNFFATLGSGASAHPFRTAQDYDNFLGRVDGFSAWSDQAIVNMRAGMQSGVVRPKVIMEKVLPQLAAHLQDDVTQTVFYRVVSEMPDTISAEDRARLTEAYEDAIGNKVVPAYRRMHDFIKDEYLAVASDEIGLTSLPGGVEWYNFAIKQTTTTDLTANEIHDIGLAEVERIKGGMESIKTQVGFEGSLSDFFDSLRTDRRFYHDEPEQLLDSYRALKSTLDAATPKLFSNIPEAEFEVRAVEPFREKSAPGASYSMPAPDGSRPGIFYVNTYNLSARPKYVAEALYLHEAVPGHHYQIALTQGLDLPMFRRFGGYTAYIEGWGLYAESLGPELGMYTDPYQRFGALDAEMVRAIRLVVDTGMHAKGWTREQALEFMMSNSSTSETRAIAEIERYIAIPGQALAYKIGQLKISELRARAAEKLGAAFDVREFHTQVLQDGALPLGVLEAKIDRWIAGQTT
ncbi:MAG: DUF885 domain-containing protein [Gammaproteobacteria bacterium]|nr:DUF885 domain-containing protein [Gammaproteobacteria bacterium]MDH3768120.1 DUF885 domain-containing protein [Gammaproteobacteria bacterium]